MTGERRPEEGREMPWKTRAASPSLHQTLDHKDLAELASQTLGIPGRQARGLAKRYLRSHGTAGRPNGFLTWICGPSLSQTD
jgi:hypothetical protein